MNIIQKVPSQMRFPLFLAALLHFVLLIALFVEISATAYRMNDIKPSQQNTIQATAVSESQISAQIHSIQKEHVEKQAAEEAHQQALQAKAQAAKQARMKEEKKIEALKVEKQKLQLQMAQEKKEKAIQKQHEKQKALALKKQQELKKQQQIKKQQDTKKALMTKQQKLQNDLMQQQLKSEQQQIHQVTSSAEKGVIDQYKAQILSLIQSNWRIQQVNDQLKCEYDVSLAPGGVVIAATLVKSSGDTALDESARVAIFKSSPLPVPDNPALFSNFRHFSLVLSPKGYVQ